MNRYELLLLVVALYVGLRYVEQNDDDHVDDEFMINMQPPLIAFLSAKL